MKIVNTDLPEWNVSELPTFDSILGMESLKAQLRVSIVEPLRKPELFEQMGLTAGDKYLLFGPPGCGKSFIARAIAGEISANYFELTPSMTVGSGDALNAVREVFEAARRRPPAVIIIDEVESLTENRDAYKASAYMRTFLNEMLIQVDDTVSANEKLMVMGSTNAPWYMDGAFLREGRFGQVIFVPPPDAEARRSFFSRIGSSKPFSAEFLEEALQLTKGFSFADLSGACKRARQAAVREVLQSGKKLETVDDAPLTEALVLSALKSQVSSVDAWFSRFDQHLAEMHKNLVSPVHEYLLQARKPESR